METKLIKILAIDDNPDNLITIQALIKEAFPIVEVFTALDGRHGLEIAASKNPDVILLDIVMPDMDGFEVCRRLKSHKILNDIPVVFVTALKGDKESRIRGLDVGAEAFLSKPIDESELIAQIRAMVKIKIANVARRNENSILAALVAERTNELKKTHSATLNLLEDLKKENEARRKTEEALHKSEELYRSVILASPDDITVTDLDGNILMVSPKGVELTGHKSESELINKNICELLKPEHRERAKLYLKKMYDGTAHNRAEEYTFVKVDGSTVDTEINAEFVRNVNGEPTSLVLSARDITERKLAQNALYESEQKYRLITDKISDVVWIMDLNGKSLFVSQSIEKFTGYSVEEYLNQTIANRFTPTSASFLLDFFKEELQRFSVVENIPGDYKKIMVADYLCKDGSVKTGEMLITPYYDYDNIFIGIHGVTRDVTERKKAEDALRASEALYRSVLMASPDDIEVTDLNGKILMASPAAYKLTGYTDDKDILGKNMTDFLVPEDAKRVKTNLFNINVRRTKGPGEYRILKADGTTVDTEINAEFVRNENGTPTGIVFILRDVTERKLAQDALVESENRYYNFINNNVDMIFVKDDQCKYLIANEAMGNFFGKSKSDILNKTDLELSNGELVFPCVASDRRALESSTAFMIEEKIGDKIYETIKFPMQLRNNQKGIGGIMRDITMRKQAEEKVNYVTRLYALLSQINQAIIRKKNVDELFETICQLTIKFGQFRMCWIGVYNENTGMIEPRKSAGHVDGYLDEIDISLVDKRRGKGPAGRAFNDAKLFFCNDISSDPIMQPWRSKALENGYQSLFATPLFRKGKAYGVFSVYASAINFFDEDEQSLLVEISENISYALDAIDSEVERNLAEEALIESEAKYREFVENSPEAIAIYSEGFVTYVNKECLKLMRAKSKDELVDKSILEFIHPDDQQIALKKIQEVSSNEIDGSLQTSEMRYLRLDGTPVFVEVKVMPMMVDSKSAIQLSARDITDRKKAEEALQKSELLLRTFIDNSPFEIWARDTNSVGILENKKMVDHYGSIIGLATGNEKNIDRKLTRIWEQIDKRVFAGEIINEETEIMVSGELRFFQQIVFPIKVNDFVMGIAGFNIDITDRKLVEEELSKSREQLTKYAAHLQNVREEERVLLSREIHDELGQILVAIKIDMGMLKQNVLKNIDKTHSEELLTKFDILSGLIDSTLKTARKIMTDLRPEVLDLLGFVEAVKQHLSTFQERYKVECQFNSDIHNLELDSKQSVALFRIIQEALNNIAKHAKATEVQVTLSLQQDKLFLEVTDNGVGFDLKHKKNIESYGLIGMKERVFLLEGELNVISAPGKGTSIQVLIPYFRK